MRRRHSSDDAQLPRSPSTLFKCSLYLASLCVRSWFDRELVKNSAQELKRMRQELLQLKGIPIPKENGDAAHEPDSPRASSSAAQQAGNAAGSKSPSSKSCVIQ